MNKCSSDSTPAFICSHIFENTKPILLVSHEDEDWQFLYGSHHYLNEIPKAVCIRHLFERDPALKEIADLSIDWKAERTAVGSQRVRTNVANTLNDHCAYC